MKLEKLSKIISLFLLITLLVTGCSSAKEPTDLSNSTDKPKVYTTLYVLEDFAKEIAKDKVTIINLVPSGVSPHDFEPTAKDMTKLVNGDMFIYNGATLEGWVDKVLNNLDNKRIKIVNASEDIPLLNESEEELDHKEEGHDHLDAHVWLDPMNALRQAEQINKGLQEMDPANKNFYESNYQLLKEKLVALDNRFKQELKNTNRKDFFVSHAAFGYLAKRYDLVQHSISGVIPSDEPSPAELKEIIDKARELNIRYILIDPKDVTKISESIAKEINAKTAEISTIGSLSKEEAAKGKNYFSLMEDNLETLKKALNE